MLNALGRINLGEALKPRTTEQQNNGISEVLNLALFLPSTGFTLVIHSSPCRKSMIANAYNSRTIPSDPQYNF